MKIVNVKKFLRSILIILAISLIFVKGSFSHKKTEYEKLYVSEGDTLWNIASSLQSNNNYYRNKDIRYIVSDIQRLNNLETSELFIDQELTIPII